MPEFASIGSSSSLKRATPKKLSIEVASKKSGPRIPQMPKFLRVLRKKSLSSANANPWPDFVHGVGKGDDINGRRLGGTPYRVGRRIGSGAQGQVRLGRNLKTKEEYAVKIERKDAIYSCLEKEWHLYNVLNGTPTAGIPSAVHYGPCGTYNALVMELLGPSLEKVFDMCKRKFSLHTILLIAIQMITRLEHIHSCNIIHRDIKPENILICKPPKRDNTLYIVDFGLSTFYVNEGNSKHIPDRHGGRTVGTPRFMSRRAHMGLETSRRDDLEELGYVLIYFLRGSLPWQNLRNHQLVLDLKKSLNVEDLCKGHPREFVEYMAHVRTLAFSETPEYDLLRQLFIARLEKEGYDPEGSMDWSGIISTTKMRVI